MRAAASRALDACRAAYTPHQLCAALCPRILELAPGRARTGLLEFLVVLVPHSSSFLSNPGHLHALTQRLGSVILQSPASSNWDGGVGLSGAGGGAYVGAGEDQGSSSATARLLAALFRLDRDAFSAMLSSLTTEIAAAVRRTLVRAAPEANAFLCAKPPQRRQERALAAADESSPTPATGVAVVRSPGVDSQAESRDPASVRARAGAAGSESPSYGMALPSPASQGVGEDTHAAVPSGVTSTSRRGSPGGWSAHDGQDSDLERKPLAPITPCASNQGTTTRADGAGGQEGGQEGSDRDFLKTCGGGSAPGLAPRAVTRPPSALAPIGDEDPAEAARRLITGLSPGARTHQKVAALSSLKSLADGEGAGARPEFWPRYFGQIVMLLLEGASASASGAEAGGGGMESSPARRRAILRVKHLQGVRCLAARRGALFPGNTEVVVGRLVEIGGGPCHAVRHEAEACLADLVGVLHPPRYLAALVPHLFVDRGGGHGVGGGGGVGRCRGPPGERARDPAGDAAEPLPQQVLNQCVALGALRALTPALSSPELLGALGAGPLLTVLDAALGGRDLEARRRSVLVFVEMYQVRCLRQVPTPGLTFLRVSSVVACCP